jgi:integrase
METSIKKNRQGIYELRWTEGRRSRTVSTRTRSLSEAKAFRSAFAQAQRDLSAVVAPTLGAIIDDYLTHRASKSQANTLRPIRGYFESLRVVDLTPEVVQGFRRARLSGKATDSTIRRDLGALVAAINWAVKNQRGVSRAEVPHVAMPPAGQARTWFLDEEAEQAFYARAMGDSVGKARLSRVTRFVALALDTGARKSAIEGLTWDRVDFSKGLIDFRDPGVAVSKKRRVIVPISQRLEPVLRRAFAEKTSGFVLDTKSNTRKAYATWVATTDHPQTTPHDLRRTWASLAVANGVDIAFVAGVLGDTVETTTKHYAHLRPETLRAAVDARWRKD